MSKDAIPIIGYTEQFSAAPGEALSFHVSSQSTSNYTAQLVHVISCDPNPEGPGVIEHALDSPINGTYPSRVQEVNLGSHVEVKKTKALDELGNFTIVATIYPTTPEQGLQGVVSRYDSAQQAGYALAIDHTGAVACFGPHRLSTGKALVSHRWYRIWMSYSVEKSTLSVGQMPLQVRNDADDQGTSHLNNISTSRGQGTLLIAAIENTSAEHHFNGKIESPILVGEALANPLTDQKNDHLIFHFDFSRDIGTPNAVDIGPHALHGEVINLPTRGVMSSQWDGSAFNWAERPAHYAAIHFHEDDLYDCDWRIDFTIKIPDNFRSGVYGVRLKTLEGDEDMIPFFVTAPIGAPQSRIAVLIPTFTYTVYANIARGNTNDQWQQTVREWDAWPWNADDHSEYGLSTYNMHSDGSGIAYSSRRRPIITMRSATVCYPGVPGSGLRHFAADAHLWYWLERLSYSFDVITDDDLHRHGARAINSYDVVMTTTHPEYHTRETLDALSAYTDGGGRFMYLGGNGFYWKVAVSDAWPDAIEIRRGEGGIRAWASEPGEYYNAFDATYGGLWRRNGRPPQQLTGVGFTSQGEHRGKGYQRTAASYEPQHQWIFEGIDDECIGDFGLSGGGAAGFELDRADVRLGTPNNAVVLASSQGDSDHFVLVPEDILTNLLSWNGEKFEELIRGDIVYFPTRNNGAVFSVGSITFCGSLPVNNCDNNISRLVRNVLDGFLKPSIP